MSANREGRKAFAVGPIGAVGGVGPTAVLSWTPPRLEPATDDTLMRLLELYRHTDVPMVRGLEKRIVPPLRAPAASTPVRAAPNGILVGYSAPGES
jgi:hypothetical protein